MVRIRNEKVLPPQRSIIYRNVTNILQNVITCNTMWRHRSRIMVVQLRKGKNDTAPVLALTPYPLANLVKIKNWYYCKCLIFSAFRPKDKSQSRSRSQNRSRIISLRNVFNPKLLSVPSRAWSSWARGVGRGRDGLTLTCQECRAVLWSPEAGQKRLWMPSGPQPQQWV
jgi:hypothetical protein